MTLEEKNAVFENVKWHLGDRVRDIVEELDIEEEFDITTEDLDVFVTTLENSIADSNLGYR